MLGTVGGCSNSKLITVEGGNLRWSSTLPDNGWIGGSVTQIKSAIASPPGNKDVLSMLQHMLTVAVNKNYDAYLLNFSDHGSMPTEIEITLINITYDIRNEEFRSGLAKNMAESERKSAPAGTRSQVESQKLTTTAGKVAWMFVIRVDPPDGIGYHVVHHVVVLGDGRWHMFRLTVDSKLFAMRLNDFNQMLEAIRYST